MAKLVNKFGVGLALGALAGHYLSTEKGQARLAQLKEEVAAFKNNPEGYKSSFIDRAKGLVADQLQTAFDQKDEILAAFGQNQENQRVDLSAEVDDIIITYTEDDLTEVTEEL